MKTFLFISILLIFSLATAAKLKSTKTFLKEIVSSSANQAFCFLNNNGTVFDLNPLTNSTVDYSIHGLSYTVNFNICKNALNKCGNKTSIVTYQNKIHLDGIADECIALSGAEAVVSKWTVLSKKNCYKFLQIFL
jgi:hypothetical protein